jgi:hypothetical protein
MLAYCTQGLGFNSQHHKTFKNDDEKGKEEKLDYTLTGEQN